MSRNSNSIRRILYATDFSPACQAALEYAKRLAECSGANLLVLHVQPGWSGIAETSEETTQELNNIQARLSDVDVELLVRSGPAGEVICWVAQERGCDEIVMGTHGRTGLVSLLMGSVAEHVIRHARCPVVTVRLRPEDERPLEEPRVGMEMPPIQPL